MSGVKLEGNALGTGVFTIKSPNSNTDRTFDLPDSSGKLVAPASEGTAGQVLTSNGAGSSPTFQNLPAGGVTSLNGQTGAITNTDYGAIGSYVIAAENDYTASQERLPNNTVAGSSLFRSNEAANINNQGISSQGTSAQVINGISSTGATSLGLSGTWRRMTRSMNSTTAGRSATNLYVRIS